jgi:hypothetical protein
MRAFAVSINGKPLCTAWIGNDGVLTSSVCWSGKPEMGHVHMHVGGLDSPTNEHLRWSVKDIGVGDEITTRIIETDAVDAVTVENVSPPNSRRGIKVNRPSTMARKEQRQDSATRYVPEE